MIAVVSAMATELPNHVVDRERGEHPGEVLERERARPEPERRAEQLRAAGQRDDDHPVEREDDHEGHEHGRHQPDDVRAPLLAPHPTSSRPRLVRHCTSVKAMVSTSSTIPIAAA